MLQTFAFHIFSMSCRKNMGPNELKNLTFFVEVTHIYVSYAGYLSRHSFRVLKNFIFGILKKRPFENFENARGLHFGRIRSFRIYFRKFVGFMRDNPIFRGNIPNFCFSPFLTASSTI